MSMKMKTLYTRWCLLGACFAILAPTWSTPAQTPFIQRTYAGLTFMGVVGSPRTVEYVDALAGSSPSWITLATFNLPGNPYLFIDTNSGGNFQRYYRGQPEGVLLRPYVGLTVSGAPDSEHAVQYLGGTGWTTLEVVTLGHEPYLWFDTGAPPGARRKYRVLDTAAAPVISSPSAMKAQRGRPMAYQIAALSYAPVTSYRALNLPDGLTVDTGTGVISGTPTTLGTNAVTLTATSARGTGVATLTLRIRLLMLDLVDIPAGTFVMGSVPGEEGHEGDESPTTTVTITEPFAMGAYEVTQAEYRDVVGSSAGFNPGDEMPVELISWHEANSFCAQLTARDRALGAIPANFAYRLPTEAEWEFAARAGSTTRFSFGNSEGDLALYAWYSTNSAGTTHSVGEKQPNAWGLYDMHGNCWELCSDWYGPYPGGSATNPQGPGSGSRRVLRGGSWFQDANGCRSSNRASIEPGFRTGDVGFRVVLAPAP